MKRPVLGFSLSLLLVAGTFAFGWWLRQSLDEPRPADQQVMASQDFSPFADARPLSPAASSGDVHSSVNLFWYVMRLVAEEYVDNVNPKEEKMMTYGALQSMIAKLNDPHSRFLEPAERVRLENAAKGRFEGIGAALSILVRKENDLEQRYLQVIAPLPGSPAEKAGLKPEDRILEIDGKWIIAYDPFYEVARLQGQHAERKQIREADRRARERLRNSLSLVEAVEQLTALAPNAEAKPMELTIKRDTKTLKVKLTPALTQVTPLEYRLLNERWGYIHLNIISHQAAEQFVNTLKTLQPRAKGLVLDLRNTTSGQIEPARRILAHLIPDQPFAQFQYRAGETDKKQPIYKKKLLSLASKPTPVKVPLVVLINRGTYNVAELMALALRTEARASLIGMPTYGEASAISLYELRDRSGFTLTVGRYLGRDGTDFHHRGVQPQIRIAGEPSQIGVPGADPTLDRALLELDKTIAKGVKKT